MHTILSQCPVCGETLEVTRLHCRNCDTTIEGHFRAERFSQLTPDQLQFVEVFLKNEGKINRVGEDLGVSYPTVRGRLRDVIAALGYQVEEEPLTISEEERRQLLDDLAKGKITSEEVLKRLGTR
ncbi:MAG TPA: DUF2089 domain-containing protein [Anaerolineae bacterium]|nr:DUF2089 domain-containing protein [Anaerolineae bacterium]